MISLCLSIIKSLVLIVFLAYVGYHVETSTKYEDLAAAGENELGNSFSLWLIILIIISESAFIFVGAETLELTRKIYRAIYEPGKLTMHDSHKSDPEHKPLKEDSSHHQ